MKIRNLCCLAVIAVTVISALCSCDRVGAPLEDTSVSDTGTSDTGSPLTPEESWVYEVYYQSNGDGTCSVSLLIDPLCKEDFEVVIPEKSPEGDTVTSFYNNQYGFATTAGMPRYISAAVFEERIRKPMLAAVERGELGALPANGRAEDHFYFKQFMTYFKLMDPSKETDRSAIAAMYEQYPFVRQEPYYVFASDASEVEAEKVRATIDRYTDFTVDDWMQDYCDLLKNLRKAPEPDEAEFIAWERSLQNFSDHMVGLVLPDSMERICPNAFRNCPNLKKIVLPEKLISVGTDAFAGCDRLEYHEYRNGCYLGSASNPYSLLVKASSAEIGSAEIHEGTKIIFYGAFEGCEALKQVKIPDGISVLPKRTFYGCKSLQEIVIPDSVTVLGDEVFCGCSSLRAVALPDGVTQMGKELFGGCGSLETVHLPTGITRIPDGMFDRCGSLCEIVFPESVTEIGSYAFRRTGLKKLTIPDHITAIGECAFYECVDLTEVVLPVSLTAIAYHAFFETGLTQIRYGGTVGQWRAIERDIVSLYGIEIICTDGTVTEQEPKG